MFNITISGDDETPKRQQVVSPWGIIDAEQVPNQEQSYFQEPYFPETYGITSKTQIPKYERAMNYVMKYGEYRGYKLKQIPEEYLIEGIESSKAGAAIPEIFALELQRRHPELR